MMRHSLNALRGTTRIFASSNRGNVSVIFAAALLPLLGFVGAAIDYSRAVNARSAMQAAVDATALMISKEAAGLTAAQITAKANAYFAALYNHPAASGVSITTAYTASANAPSTVKIDGAGTVATDFMRLMGYNTVPISVTSTTTWGNQRMRVALALDTTGSMAQDGKMDALKPAAKSLIDQVMAMASNTGDVMVSIVPFAKDVNVGSSNYNQSWVKWDDWDDKNQSCSGWGWGWGGGGCSANNHNTWNGCVTDRDQSYDVTSTAPTSAATYFPAEQDNNCPERLMTLSSDKTALKAKIDALYPSGATNQPIGLAWAWLSLLQQAPLNAPAEASGYTYQKVIILMSDGLNTKNRWYGNGSSPSSQIDTRQQTLCNNVKAAGITLYTIHVNTDGDPTSTVLQNCASSSDKFYTLTSSSQMLSVFNAIGTQLAKLRVSK
jgi:Flp pilus assembly protein TadG